MLDPSLHDPSLFFQPVRAPILPPPQLPQPRYFDDVDTVIGTPEADVFEVDALRISFYPTDASIIRELRPQSSEVDILVYQEQERANYLERFQAPTARSYTYIEDFDPIEDEIIFGGKPYRIEIDDEIIAGESSDDIAHFVSMGSPAIDWDAFGFGSPTIDWDDFTASKFFGPYAPAHSTVSLKTAQIMH